MSGFELVESNNQTDLRKYIYGHCYSSKVKFTKVVFIVNTHIVFEY